MAELSPRLPFRSSRAAVTMMVLGAALAAIPASAENGRVFGFCQDGVQIGWNFYCDPSKRPAPKPKAMEAKPEATPAPATDTPDPYPATTAIETARKELDEIRNRAILDPTPENLSAYMFAQKAMVDQAGRFADIWERVLFRTPGLDANQSWPLSQIGGQVAADQKAAQWTGALKEASSRLGFLVVVSDEASCPLCAKQLEVIRQMQASYGITPLVVSKDGSHHPLYPSASPDQGQIKSLGLEANPTPFIALVEPRTGQVQPLGSGLLTEDVILERVFVVTQVPEGQRYMEKN
jgi:conjugal transfer pilus assembly protein TraF